MDARRVLRLIVTVPLATFLVAPPRAGATGDPAGDGPAAHPAAGLEIPCDADGGAFGL